MTVQVDTTSRYESARLAEGARRLAWMLDGLHAAAQELYVGLTPGALQAFDSDLEDLIAECHGLRRLVSASWDRVTARTEADAPEGDATSQRADA